MERRTIQYIADACGGELWTPAKSGGASIEVTGVSTDSRSIAQGELFLAIRGEHFDGHQYLDVAVNRGAAGVLYERDGAEGKMVSKVPTIKVADSRRAFLDVAGCYRNDFELPLVAVAGSNGKTTTKDLIQSILRDRLATVASEASFNNEIGVPKTLLRLNNKTRAAVLEVGSSYPGELEALLRRVRPNIGVVTSIGREHLEFFGDLNGVIEEESALARSISEDGVLIFNGDCEGVEHFRRHCAGRLIVVGHGHTSDVVLREESTREGLQVSLEFREEGEQLEVDLPIVGRHQAMNLALSAVVSKELGLSLEAVQAGLLACRPSPRRMELIRGSQFSLLDDSYNANPDSMIRALESLSELPTTGRRIAVLGEMAEVGQQSPSLHREIGSKAGELGLDQLWAVGEGVATRYREGANATGLRYVMVFRDARACASSLQDGLREEDLVLVKGSRAARMDIVADAIRSRLKGGRA